MKSETILILAILLGLALFAVGSCNTTFKPALINWERREKPIFPLRPDRRKDKVPE